MSWRRVAGIYLVLALLAGWVLVVERDAPPIEPAPAQAPVGASLLDAAADAVTAVIFRREGKVVRAGRADRRWRVIEPAGADVPSDLIEATIATLTAGQAAERLTDVPEPELAAYGLDVPSTTLELVMDPAGHSVTVQVGARNPTRTAVYARRGDQPAIFLVGMNLGYYLDLIFEAAKT
jgi:hypothetical protein